MKKLLTVSVMVAMVLTLAVPAGAQDQYDGTDPGEKVCVVPEGCDGGSQYDAGSGAAGDPEEPVCVQLEGCDENTQYDGGGASEGVDPQEPVCAIPEGCGGDAQYEGTEATGQEVDAPATQAPTPPAQAPEAAIPSDAPADAEEPGAANTSTAGRASTPVSASARVPVSAPASAGRNTETGGAQEIKTLPNTGGSATVVVGFLLVSLGVLVRGALR